MMSGSTASYHNLPLLCALVMTGGLLLVLGLVGFTTRSSLLHRGISAMFMLLGGIVTLIGGSVFHADASGQVFALSAFAVTVAQAVILMSICLRRGSDQGCGESAGDTNG